MDTRDKLNQMMRDAKQVLKEQEDNDIDIYAEYRDEFEKDNVTPTENSEGYSSEEYVSKKLRYEHSEEELQEEEEIMDFARIENEELLFVGGPTKSEVESWKSKYSMSNVYIVEVADEIFIFRTLNRFEYKQLIRQANLDASQREEVVCETVVLFPYNYTWRSMATKNAGIPSTLSQIIMNKSGFTEEYSIERL